MEVAARFARDAVDAAEEAGVPAAGLLAGLPFTRAELANVGARIRWDDLAELCDRMAAALGTNERLEEHGRRTVRRVSTWTIVRIVPHLVGPTVLLRIGMQFAAPSVFPHIRHSLEMQPGGTMRFTLTLPSQYRGCEAFFRGSVGGIGSIPTIFGYPPALVAVVSIGPHGFVIDVTPPPNRTVFDRVLGAVRALRGESALFEEMVRQHEAMQDVFGVLFRTENELHQLMERIPDPLTVHRDGVILWTNRAFVDAMGFASAEEVRGRHLLDLVHPMDRAAAMERLGSSSNASRVERIRVQVKDGSLRTFELSDSQSVIYEQEPARMVLARDVTEREALREQLLLADRMSQLGFLAAGVAHEINNPLAYALAAMDRAKEELGAGSIEGAQSSLLIAREGAERVRAITNDLRLFTRGGEPRAEAIDLAGVIRATAELAAANIRTLGRLALDLRPIPQVLADAGRLGQVLMNLLANAIDAVADGDPATNQITLRAYTDPEGRAVVEVEDNGHGIPPAVRSRIFEPFFTTKGPRSGSGLGLAICHRIVYELGGRIELAPTSSKGALFRMILPACAPSAHSRPNTATGPRNGDRLRVLVIDDEAPLARALGLMLEDDHDVEVVTSGEDALKRFEAGAEYDAILCDLMMAGIGGMEVHSKLVNGRPALARRLVFMTGGAFGANVQKFLGAVKNPCLDKPFTREQALGAMNMVRDLG